MQRRSFLAMPGLAAASPAQQTRPDFASPRQPSARPNAIWLFADQLRPQALSCNGDPNVRTPNIDRLSTEGVQFTQAVAGFPLCCPFRGSLLTGRYPHQCVPGHEHPLPPGQPTIAEPLKQSGYHTAWFGKWHLSGWHERDGRGAFHIVPPARRGGFDTWVGYENNNSQYDCWVHGGQGSDAFHYRLPGYETDELTNLFLGHLRARAAAREAGKPQPFFACLSVQPPHDPYVAPPDYMRRFAPARLEMRPNVPALDSVQPLARRELAGYYAMIENWDWNVGRILDTLAQTGLAADTHVLVFSDHGDMHGSHGMFRKTNPFEESTRIPFLIAGEIPRYEGRNNGRWPVLLNAPDIAPTTLGLCGIPRPSWMQGADLTASRFADESRRPPLPDSAYLQNVIPTGHAHSINKPYRGLITRDGWKLVCFEQMSWLMFNLNEDPYELVNQAHNSRYRVERRKLLDRLKQWGADTGDRFALPAD